MVVVVSAQDPAKYPAGVDPKKCPKYEFINLILSVELLTFYFKTVSQFVIMPHSITLLLKSNGTNGNNNKNLNNLNNNGMHHNHNNGMHHNPNNGMHHNHNNGMHHNNHNNGLHSHNNGIHNHNNGKLLLNHNGMPQLHKHQANTQLEFQQNHVQTTHIVMFLVPQLDQLDHHVLHHSKDLLKDYTQLEFQHNLVQTTLNANY